MRIVHILVLHEGFIDSSCHRIDSFRGVQVFFFVRRSDKAQFYQAARHITFSEDEKPGLMYAFVDAAGRRTDRVLYQPCQFDALLHVRILHELEHDIAFRRFRVETLVSLLVSCFHRDDGVLAHGNVQVVLRTVHTQCVNLKALGIMAWHNGIGVDGDEQVCLCLVGNVSTLVQRNEDITSAGVDYIHVWQVLLDISAEGKSNVQVDVLLFRESTEGTGVMSAMPGINNKCEPSVRSP